MVLKISIVSNGFVDYALHFSTHPSNLILIFINFHFYKSSLEYRFLYCKLLSEIVNYEPGISGLFSLFYFSLKFPIFVNII